MSSVVKVRAAQDWERVYRAMLRGRRFDEIVLALQRQGVVDSFAEGKGQEAAQVGAIADLVDGDMVFPSYRQPAAALERGVEPIDLMRLYAGASFCAWDWRATGFAPYAIPVGSQLAHATGWAWAARLRGEKSVTVVFFGDGSSSQGEVHEAMNYAGVFRAPVIFLLENNGWAISLPTARQTRAESLYLRAPGYGIAGEAVDGNDVEAVRHVVRAAIERARNGDGPTLIEAKTYRLGGHTTSDDHRRYRSEDEVATWAEADPIARLRQAVAGAPEADDALGRIAEEIDVEMNRATDAFLEERGRG
jgi:pyruvate dehydrogenase E1 component alpha subunit